MIKILSSISNTSDTNDNTKFVPKTGGTFTGNVTFNRYLDITAWPGYGEGAANVWYNGTTKTLTYEGGVTDVNLNAKSATKLKTARNINGVPFDGSQDITISVPAAATEAPLSDANAATVGKSVNYAREDHIHAYPKYLKDFLGSINIGISYTGSITTTNWVCAWDNDSGGTSIRGISVANLRKQMGLGTTGVLGVEYGGTGTTTGAVASATKVANALKFTGAITASYDGSEAITVNIPTVSSTADKVAHALTFTNGSTAIFDGSQNISVSIPKTAADVDAVSKTSGGTFENTVQFNRYVQIKAWPNYGDGVAKIWYDSNHKTLACDGECTDIRLNAKSATTASSADKVNHKLTFSGASTASFDGSADVSVAIPTSLKNPNKLTFSGASTATYDGSAAVTVDIPAKPSTAGTADKVGHDITVYYHTHGSSYNTASTRSDYKYNGSNGLSLNIYTYGAGNGITLNTTSFCFGLTTTGVTANTYGSATVYPQFTVDSYGRITSATTHTVPKYTVTLLWSNSNTSAAFASQIVNFNPSTIYYDAVAIVPVNDINSNSCVNFFNGFTRVVTAFTLTSYYINTANWMEFHFRTVQIALTNANFGGGNFIRLGSNNNAMNFDANWQATRCVPAYIYGLKF